MVSLSLSLLLQIELMFSYFGLECVMQLCPAQCDRKHCSPDECEVVTSFDLIPALCETTVTASSSLCGYSAMLPVCLSCRYVIYKSTRHTGDLKKRQRDKMIGKRQY